MKSLLRLGLIAIGLLLAHSAPASANCTGTAVHGGAHTCYLINTTNAWTVSGTWSASPASAPGTPSASCSCVPATSAPFDDIVLDGGVTAATFGTAAATYHTIDTNLSGDAGGAFAGTATQTTSFSIDGNYFYINSGMTITAAGNRTITFISTTGTSGSPTAISTNGVTMPNLTFNGSGGYFEVLTALISQNVTSSVGLILTAGTLDFTTNNPTVTMPFFNAAASTTLNCGTGQWTLTGNTSGANLWVDAATISCASTPITFTPTAALTASQTFATNGGSFGAVVFNGVSGGGEYPYFVTGSPTFTSLTLNSSSGPLRVVTTTATTYTLTNLTITGTSSNQVMLLPTQGGAFATTLTVTNAPSMTWAAISGMNFTNAATATSSFNLGGNTNLTVTSPSGGGHIIGG